MGTIIVTPPSSGGGGGGSVPSGTVILQGTWDPNSAALPTNTPTIGYAWVVSVAGTYSVSVVGGTVSNWTVGDLLLYTANGWDSVDGGAVNIQSLQTQINSLLASIPQTTWVAGSMNF